MSGTLRVNACCTCTTWSCWNLLFWERSSKIDVCMKSSQQKYRIVSIHLIRRRYIHMLKLLCFYACSARSCWTTDLRWAERQNCCVHEGTCTCLRGLSRVEGKCFHVLSFSSVSFTGTWEFVWGGMYVTMFLGDCFFDILNTWIQRLFMLKVNIATLHWTYARQCYATWH